MQLQALEDDGIGSEGSSSDDSSDDDTLHFSQALQRNTPFGHNLPPVNSQVSKFTMSYRTVPVPVASMCLDQRCRPFPGIEARWRGRVPS